MVKVNDTFEIDFDGNGWLVYEWRDGLNPKTKEPSRRLSGPRNYSQLSHVCASIIDRSAGSACHESRNIIEAIKQAKNDLHVAICGGGWK